MAQKRNFTAQKLGNLVNTTGAWTYTVTSNIVALQHTAAAETTVLFLTIPRTQPPMSEWSDAVSVISVPYSIATAALSGAATAVLDLLVTDPTTRIVSRTAVTQTLAISGSDTTGTAVGSYSADITITTPLALTEGQELVLEISFPCAATTVLKVFGLEVTFK